MSLHPSFALAGVSFAPGDCKPYGTLTRAIHAPSCMNPDIQVICYYGVAGPWIKNDETLIAYFPLIWGMVMCQLLRQGKTIYFYGDVDTVTDLVTNTNWNYL